MRCLVTGGAGFIGSHIVNRLVNDDHEVIIFDDLSTGKKENINPKAKFFKVDISDVNVFDDKSGNQNLGFTFSDYKPIFDTKNEDIKKVRETISFKKVKFVNDY